MGSQFRRVHAARGARLARIWAGVLSAQPLPTSCNKQGLRLSVQAHPGAQGRVSAMEEGGNGAPMTLSVLLIVELSNIKLKLKLNLPGAMRARLSLSALPPPTRPSCSLLCVCVYSYSRDKMITARQTRPFRAS